MFWSISNQYPDSVNRLHVQIRLVGNFGFSACVPWTIRADKSLCFVCQEAKDDLHNFPFDCSYFRKNFDSLWSNLDVKAQTAVLQMVVRFLLLLRISTKTVKLCFF